MIAVKDNTSDKKLSPEEQKKQDEVNCMFTDMTERYPVAQMIEFVASMSGPTLPDDINQKERRPISAEAIQIFDFKRLDSSLQIDYAKTCMEYCNHLIRQFQHEILHNCNSGDKENDNTWFQAWKASLNRYQNLHKQIENCWGTFIEEKVKSDGMRPNILVQAKVVSDAAEAEFQAGKIRITKECPTKETIEGLDCTVVSLSTVNNETAQSCSKQVHQIGSPKKQDVPSASVPSRSIVPRIVHSREELHPESPVPRFAPGKFNADMHKLAKLKYPLGKAYSGVSLQVIVETHENYIHWIYTETVRGSRQPPLQELLDFYEYWTAYTGRRGLPFFNDFYPESYYHVPSAPTSPIRDSGINANWTPSTPKAPPMYSNIPLPSVPDIKRRSNTDLPAIQRNTIQNPYAKKQPGNQSAPVTPSTSSMCSASKEDSAYAPGFTIPGASKKDSPKLEVASIPVRSPRSPNSKSQLSLSNKFLGTLDAVAEGGNNKPVSNILQQKENIDSVTREPNVEATENEASFNTKEAPQHSGSESEGSKCQEPNMKKNKKESWIVDDGGDADGMKALNEVRRLAGKEPLPLQQVHAECARSKRRVLCDSSDDEGTYQSALHQNKKHASKLDRKEDDMKIGKCASQRKSNRKQRLRTKYSSRNKYILSDCSEVSDDHLSPESSSEDISSNEEEKHNKQMKRKAPTTTKHTHTQYASDDSSVDVDKLVRINVCVFKSNRER